MNRNRLFFLILVGAAFSCNAMDLPMNDASTNQALSKFSGCFVAIKDPRYSQQGFRLTSDNSIVFAHIDESSIPDRNGLGIMGYFLYKLIERINKSEDMLCLLPDLLRAAPGLYIRLATEEEITAAAQKIENKEVQLGTGNNVQASLRLLKSARNVTKVK